jgi:hypothetical protein
MDNICMAFLAVLIGLFFWWATTKITVNIEVTTPKTGEVLEK